VSLALVYCGKEWRAQRGILVAYALLVFVCLTIGFTLVPEYWWLEDGRGALSLSWFVAAGVIGVVAFVAPALVRSEYGPKDDQLVRRLPGALGPSFRGKMLFLVLAAMLLPLLGLLVGEAFLTAYGKSWGDLWTTRGGGLVGMEGNDVYVVLALPWTVYACGAAMLLVPWVWAIGTWMPAGRMALGGALLFVLLLGVVLFAVSRQCPNIETGLAAWPWLVFATLLAFVVAGSSWATGRRGGGALRSAKVGLLTFGAAVLPPGLWLGDRVHDYLRPDLETVLVQGVIGLTPDHHYALAYGAQDPNWFGVPLRIDLQTGVAQQLGGYRDTYTGSLVDSWAPHERGSCRLWRTHGEDVTQQRLFDLATGIWQAIGYDQKQNLPLVPPELDDVIAADARETTCFRGPDGIAVWPAAGKLRFGTADGKVDEVPWPYGNERYLVSCGHGLRMLGGEPQVLFDFVHRKRIEVPALGKCGGFAVRGQWVLAPQAGKRGWHRFDVATGELVQLDELRDLGLIGLFDDDHLLCSGSSSLLLYRPADRTLVSLGENVPVDLCRHVVTQLGRWGSLLPRDPLGRIWLTDGGEGTTCIVVGPDRSVSRRTPRWGSGSWNRVLAWLDGERVLQLVDGKVLEQDLNTGGRSVLFPRSQR
jgi:hypothetical protein